MKNRTVRFILFLLAVSGAGGATYMIITLEQRAAVDRVEQRDIRDQAAGILALIAELRADQRGYVAAGQGQEFWTTRVTHALTAVDSQVRELRNAVRSEAASSAVDSAAVALENFAKLDARAQEHVNLGQRLLASDLIFSDGLEMTVSATAQIEAALRQEIQTRETNAGLVRQQEIWAAAGSAAVLLLVAVLLVPLPALRETSEDKARIAQPASPPDIFVSAKDVAPPVRVAGLRPAPDLAAAAQLCTELGRVMETRELPPLLARAAEILDAAGMVVWVSDRTGVELKPVLTQGYPDKVVNQMRSMPRDANNAAAQAFRLAQLRVVPQTDQGNGALVVPLITPAGCIGVFAVELRHGGEQQEPTRALVTILAAQMATLVGAVPAPSGAAAHAQA